MDSFFYYFTSSVERKHFFSFSYLAFCRKCVCVLASAERRYNVDTQRHRKIQLKLFGVQCQSLEKEDNNLSYVIPL